MKGKWVHTPGQAPCLLDQNRPELTIGRTLSHDIVLMDPTISRRHAVLSWRDGQVILQDLDSRHGCFVNGIQIHAPTRIGKNDKVMLGPIPLWLEDSETPTTKPTDMGPRTFTIPVNTLRDWRMVETIPGIPAKWLECLDALQELSHQLLKDLPAEALLETVLDRLFHFLGASRGALLLKQRDGSNRLLATRTRQAGEEVPFALSTAAVDAAFHRCEASIVGAHAADVLDRGDAHPAGSHMTVPIESGGTVLGLLHFESDSSGFSHQDLRFVVGLSHLAASKLVQQATRELQARRREMERDLLTLEETTRAKGAFLATLGQEVRTSLETILGAIHMAADDPIPPTTRERLRRIDQAGNVLYTRMDDIRHFLKLESRSVSLEQTPFRLGDLFETLEGIYLSRAEAKGIQLTFRTSPELPATLLGDPLRLGQILLNLVANALASTYEGSVQVMAKLASLQADVAQVGFHVSDTGRGIPVQQRATLFQNPTPVDVSGPPQGRGLGLIIAAHLVENLGGTLALEEGTSQGSTFAFTLPFPVTASYRSFADALAYDALRRVPQVAMSLRGKRVLLVENDPLNRELVFEIITRAGARVTQVSLAQEALNLLSREGFDAILLDCNLPDLEGPELAKRIRQQGATRMPMVAISGDGSSEARKRCLTAGMSDFLPKPVQPTHLLRALVECMRLPDPSGIRATAPLNHYAEDPFLPLRPVMDVAEMLHRTGDDTSLLRDLLDLFVKHYATSAEEIRLALQDKDYQAAARCVHAVKGAAATLSATALFQAARELEVGISGGTAPAPGQFSVFSTAHAAVLERASAYLQQ